MHYGALTGFIITTASVTVLFPVLSFFLYSLSLSFLRNKAPISRKCFSVDILIPAYNEVDTLKATVTSILEAVKALKQEFSADEIKITIGLDGSDEGTRNAALTFTSNGLVRINDRKENLGKWKTISEMVSLASQDWSIIVDCGTLWSENFLLQLRARAIKTNKVGFAPGYFQKKSSKLEKIIWWQERVLKQIENLSGGPISVHGATMVFQTNVLKNVIEKLSFRTWLNDDVVIALLARTHGEIEYLGKKLSVSDCGQKDNAPEFNRRKRMTVGNIEWIRFLWIEILFSNPITACIALRRIARVFWIYNFGFAFGFLLSLLTGQAFTVFMGLPLLFFLLQLHPKIGQAARASLISPALIVSRDLYVKWS